MKKEKVVSSLICKNLGNNFYISQDYEQERTDAVQSLKWKET
jgi:hypothetical protein